MDATLLRDNTKTELYTPAAAVVAGDIVSIDGRVGVAVADIAANVAGAVYTDGVFSVQNIAAISSRGTVMGFDANGDPYGGTAGTGCATRTLSTADLIIGTLVAAVTATTKRAEIDLNVIPADVAFLFAGKVHEEVSDNLTLDIQDTGKVMWVDTDAKAITLPAVATGFEFIIANGGYDGETIITVSPDANDKIMGADLAGVDNKDRVNTKLTAKWGDYLHLVYGTADGWNVVAERGTWAAQA